MGDRTNLNLSVRGATDPRTRAAVAAVFETYAGPRGDESLSGYYVDDEDPTTGALDLGAHEVRVGCVEQVAAALRALVADGTHDDDDQHVPVEDFAWEVHDEPEYEWLGELVMHVPGLPDFTSDCDANGTPVVAPTALVQLVDEAPDLDTVRRQMRAVAGTDHLAAFSD